MFSYCTYISKQVGNLFPISREIFNARYNQCNTDPKDFSLDEGLLKRDKLPPLALATEIMRKSVGDSKLPRSQEEYKLSSPKKKILTTDILQVLFFFLYFIRVMKYELFMKYICKFFNIYRNQRFRKTRRCFFGKDKRISGKNHVKNCYSSSIKN